MPSRRQRADAIRLLSIDAVQKAKSGHPGMPMGMADIAEVLWHDFLQHHPQNPHFINRDRFVLSNGHGSMLQYALLHLTGYDLTIDDLKSFRQLHSKTPGHPEVEITPGVETTTGPLGQGLANAVGFAIAEKHLASEFNRPDFPLLDHFVYCFCGDGDLMEGISHEVCSLAGTLGLGKLIVFYDDNGISIDGKIDRWFTDNTPLRFQAYGWHVIPDVDGHDPNAIHDAILLAQKNTAQPTIICCKTMIGYGSPNKAGTAATHGAALGDEEVANVRSHLAWPHEPFSVPDEIYQSFDARKQGEGLEAAWNALFERYQKAYPQESEAFLRRFKGELPANFPDQVESLIANMEEKRPSCATRKASQMCLNVFAKNLPELFGGSADLTESNCTQWDGSDVFSRDTPSGRYVHYGVREFGMSAIMNGIALYGGITPFGGTFLTFSDYARNAVRMASIMQQRVIFVYSHDSIGLGEDGPTHQPVEQLPSLRMIPNLKLWRPCDALETVFAWQAAIEHHGPTCLLFSRQNVSYQTRNVEQIKNIARGGYILLEPEEAMDLIIIATGSEVQLAMKVSEALKEKGIQARLVSMPSTETFLAQSAAYQEKILPKAMTCRVVIEAAASDYWYRFVGHQGKIFGLDRFGASAPAEDIYKDCGFSVEALTDKIKSLFFSSTDKLKTTETKHASGMQK